ncbi:MAG: LLM class flavin-dependent oxidoreductase [Pseudomonadota bacterium]
MGVAVGIGLMDSPFQSASEFWGWVDRCEESPLDSIWQTDRLISPFPMLECMSLMAALAGRTRRIKFGFNVVSLAFRDPLLVAKQCATIDYLSDGRLLPAFGIGNPRAPEWRAVGIDTKGRGKRTDEALDVIVRLWREDKVDFEGTYFQLSGASINPKPKQTNIPVWIGGDSPAAVRRTARIGTGWQAGLQTPAEVAPVIAAIRAEVVKTGRSIDDDHYGAAFPYYFGSADDAGPQRHLQRHKERTGKDGEDYMAVGGADEIVQRLSEYIDAGASKFILRPIAANGKEAIDQTERLIEQVLPQVSARWPRK